jgi:hypothetical protein
LIERQEEQMMERKIDTDLVLIPKDVVVMVEDVTCNEQHVRENKNAWSLGLVCLLAV